MTLEFDDELDLESQDEQEASPGRESDAPQESQEFSGREFGKTIVYFLVSGAVAIGLSEWSRSLGDNWPVWLYGIFFSFLLLVMFDAITKSIEEVLESFRKDGSEQELATVTMTVLGSAVLFGLFCRELQAAAGAEFKLPDGEFTSTLAWIGFGFDNLAEAVFLDIPAVYELHFADITPTGFYTRTLLLVYRLLIDVLLIKVVIKYWILWYKHSASESFKIFAGF